MHCNSKWFSLTSVFFSAFIWVFFTFIFRFRSCILFFAFLKQQKDMLNGVLRSIVWRVNKSFGTGSHVFGERSVCHFVDEVGPHHVEDEEDGEQSIENVVCRKHLQNLRSLDCSTEIERGIITNGNEQFTIRILFD